MASFRYRAQIPAEQTGADLNTTDADILVFTKPTEEDCKLALQNQDKKIVVDFCDDHFARFPHYREMAMLADRITCPSKAMQDVIHGQGFDSVQVNDPYEYWGDPHANGDRLLWFGHQSNLGEIIPHIQAGTKVEVVTGETELVGNYTRWSVQNLATSLGRSHIVLIPDGKATRSNNRLVNALAAGCFVVAGEQHRDCRHFIWANKSIRAGIQFAGAFKDELNDMVREGQEWVQANYSPETVGEQWKSAFVSI